MNKYIFTIFVLLIIVFSSTNLFAQTATLPAGSGTSGSPYLIATLNNLYWVSTNVASSSGKFYKQTADIDASSTSSGWFSGAGWVAIGNSTNKFAGDYDGNGFAIDNLFISRVGTDYQGLFGYTNSATIQNLGVTNVDITGGTYTGGLVGFNNGTISNCYADAVIVGASNVGGLVGKNLGTIQRSYTAGSSSAGNRLGGFVGVQQSGASISNSYSLVAVTSSVSQNIYGGLVGENNGTITNSYANGLMTVNLNVYGGLVGRNGTATNSFWDTETTGLSISAGGTGKTTALMKTQSTFTNAFWDFVGETTNGTNDYWTRDDNKNGGYPFLSWQTFPNSVTFTDGSSFVTTPTAGQTNQPIGRLALSTNTLGSVFDGIWVKLNGTRTGLTNFKLWESSDNSFNAASDTQIGSTVAADPGDGNFIWFLSLSKALSTIDKFYFITCDIASGATGSIQAFISGNKEIMLGFSTLNSTITNSALSSAVEPLPVELTSFSASVVGNTIELKWRTETEINNYGFEIERASSSTTPVRTEWTKIGFVQGHGTSNIPHNYSYIDNNLLGGVKLYYRLKQIDIDGKFEYSDILSVSLKTSKKVELMQNSPNPFNPSTSIKFFIPNTSDVTIKIYDLRGSEVTTLIQEQSSAGFHIVFWNGRNSRGILASSGVYFYRLLAESKVGNFTETKKMMLLK